jgi:hypothetical protein
MAVAQRWADKRADRGRLEIANGSGGMLYASHKKR